MQITEAVNMNWNTKKIFQGGSLSQDAEILETTLRAHGLLAMKMCGAGTSGYILAFFRDNVPKDVIASSDLLEFKLERLGLRVEEI